MHWIVSGHFWGPALDVVSALATVTAAWLAWLAIQRGNQQSRDSMEAIQRERRINFEIDHLIRVLHPIEDEILNNAVTPIAFELSLLPSDDPNLMRVRAWYLREQNQRTPEVDALLARDDGNGISPIRKPEINDGVCFKDTMVEDVRRAIQARLDERGS